VIARFRIGLSRPSTPDLVHQLRNFGESLSRSLAGKAHVDIGEVDAATEHFSVLVSEKRYLGEVLVELRKRMHPRDLDAKFTIERVRE
jgi:hypothetical protein